MDRDEKMGYLLGGLASAWAVGGLLLPALAAQRIQDAGVAVPGLEEGLAAFYLAVFGSLRSVPSSSRSVATGDPGICRQSLCSSSSSS